MTDEKKEIITLNGVKAITNTTTGQTVEAEGDSFTDEEFVDALDTLYPPSEEVKLAMYEE